MQLSVVLQLNTGRGSDDNLKVDFLGIDACWIAVYVLCRNAQLNLTILIISCMCMVMPSLFVNCPTVICSPNMLFLMGETPLVNCGPRSILLHRIQSTAILVVLFSANIIIHTIHLILCYSKPVRLTTSLFRWGKVLWLCCAGSTLAPESLVLRRTTSRRHQPSTCFLAPTGSINLGFILRENLPLYASHLPLGVPNGRVLYAYQALFLAPLPGRSRHAARGVSTSQSLYFVFVLLSFIYYFVCCTKSKYKKVSC